jgi:hypothetical protein
MKKAVLWLSWVVLVCTFVSCKHRDVRVIISDTPITVGPDWVRVTLPQSVIAKWEYQVVYLTANTQFDPGFPGRGLKLEDGSIVLPEINLLTNAGAQYPFSLYDTNGRVLEFANRTVPVGTRFVELRIRSSKPLVFAKITWISYMPEDTKTGNPE